MKLGIMQGRLVPPEPGRFQSFPLARWREEFALAAATGLDAIEWIYDAYAEQVNPLATLEGRREIARLSAAHGVAVDSICADWFMDYPLTGATGAAALERWARLPWLLERAAHLRIARIVIPFVDASALHSAAQIDAVVGGLCEAAPLLERFGIELHLETDLSPADFSHLLERLPHPRIKVNYDSGNSAALGYRPADEFAAYGERVGSVHIKDRRRGGGTVPLGTGDTDFEALFGALERLRYSGDFVLQAARGACGEELEWTRRQATFAQRLLERLRHT